MSVVIFLSDLGNMESTVTTCRHKGKDYLTVLGRKNQTNARKVKNNAYSVRPRSEKSKYVFSQSIIVWLCCIQTHNNMPFAIGLKLLFDQSLCISTAQALVTKTK